MRDVVVSTYVTLDGVFEEPGWSAPYWSDQAQLFARDQLWASDALLLGRKTWEASPSTGRPTNGSSGRGSSLSA
jgi:dihydrofolate reductase